jgi:putative membrane protein
VERAAFLARHWPVLVLLTLPITMLTLGLFLFVINGLMFWLARGAKALTGLELNDMLRGG